jgi:hypothetical protein
MRIFQKPRCNKPYLAFVSIGRKLRKAPTSSLPPPSPNLRNKRGGVLHTSARSMSSLDETAQTPSTCVEIISQPLGGNRGHYAFLAHDAA